MARETSGNERLAADRSPNEANGLGNQPAVPTSRPEGRRRTLLPGQPFEMMNQDFQSAMGKSTSGSHPTWNNAWLSEGETKTNRLRFLLIQTRRKLLLLHRAGRPAKPFRRRRMPLWAGQLISWALALRPAASKLSKRSWNHYHLTPGWRSC